MYISQLIRFARVCSHVEVKSMQRSRTETNRTQSQPSKPKREITNITNSQNTKRTYGQPSEQLFPKSLRWPLSNRNRSKNNMNTHKVKRHRNTLTPKTGNREDLNARNKCLTAKLLKQGYRYHKLRKASSKFYRRHHELIPKFNVGLKSLLHQGLSEPEFYGDLVNKFKNIMGRTDFSDQFRKITMCHKRICYDLNVM